MGKPREPIELILQKGKKHLTIDEIAARREQEPKVVFDPNNIDVPSYLTKTQKSEFIKICKQLDALHIMGETDIDAVARYIMSRDLYLKITRSIKGEILQDPIKLDQYMKNQSRAFNQCTQAARDLGLTISSRCKIVVPVTEKPAPPENKFKKFKAAD